jgi:hypothetical protein
MASSRRRSCSSSRPRPGFETAEQGQQTGISNRTDQEELLDERLAVEKLNTALELQYRSALQYSVVASSLVGLEAQALGAQLKGSATKS